MVERVICCFRVADWEPNLQSVVDRCQTCDAAIWVALSSPRSSRKLCMQCAAAEIAADPDAIVAPPTKRQLADLKRLWRE